MAKPFANAPKYTGSILDTYIFAIQVGTTQGDSGLPEMMYITGEKLKAYVREGFGSAMNFVGECSSALPATAEANDYFYASASFTVDGVVYQQYHFYEYDGQNWVDISGVLFQYAKQSDLDEAIQDIEELQETATDLQSQIDAISGAETVKGTVATTGDLPASPSTGDKYWVTSEECYYVYNGSQWVATGHSGTGLFIRSGKLYMRYKITT